MPRELSVLADAHRQRADVGWIPLVTLTLWRDRYGPAPQSLTLYCSTATYYLPHAGHSELVEYLPLIQTTGQVGDSLEAAAPETAPASFDPVLANTVPIPADGVTVPRFSALFRNALTDVGYDRGGGECTVRWLPPGGVVGIDDVLLYAGTISTIDGLEDETVTVRSTSAEGVVRIPILGAAIGPGGAGSSITVTYTAGQLEQNDTGVIQDTCVRYTTLPLPANFPVFSDAVTPALRTCWLTLYRQPTNTTTTLNYTVALSFTGVADGQFYLNVMGSNANPSSWTGYSDMSANAGATIGGLYSLVPYPATAQIVAVSTYSTITLLFSTDTNTHIDATFTISAIGFA